MPKNTNIFCFIGKKATAIIISISLSLFQPLSIANSYASTLPLLPIEVDGTTNTIIDKAANGVPIVNIATPNSGGLSHNKFKDYNVNKSGLILNNATGNHHGIVRTDIGGLVVDNPNLSNSGVAKIILNEVTSTNKSFINGYTEVAGSKAEVIIANPNGVSFNGAGFLNIGRLTAVVGSANQFNPHRNDLTFNLNGNNNAQNQLGDDNSFLPKLTISGLGLDVSKVDKVDLISSTMNIVAPIYGDDDNVTSLKVGDEQFNYSTKEVTSSGLSTPEEIAPEEIAIDASNLADIQTGQVYIIVTKDGAGVKYSGDMIASRGGVSIDAKGNIIYNGNINSKSGDIDVKTTNGDITTSGIIQSQNQDSDVNIEASNKFNNQGQILSARDINVMVGDDINNKNSLIIARNDVNLDVKDLDNHLGTIQGNNKLNIKASGNITDSGNLKALKEINIDLGKQDYEIVGDLQSDGSVNIKANNINNKANITALDEIKITASDGFSNQLVKDGDSSSDIKIATNGNITIEANNDIDNYGILSAKTILFLKSINGDITNYDGAKLIASNQSNPKSSQLILQADNGTINQNSPNSVVVDGNHTITANNYTNTGRIDISGDLTFNITGDLINDIGAMIYAGSDMLFNVTNGNLTNKQDATIYADNNITINANHIDNISANIESYQGDITIDANSLNNSRSSFATQNSARQIYNYKRDGAYWHSLHQYSYDGQNGKIATISAGNDLSLDIDDNLTNDGSAIYAQNNITINSSNNNANISNNSHYVYSGTREYFLGKKGHYGDHTWSKWGGGKWNHHSQKLIYNDQQYATGLIKAGGSIAINGNYKSAIVSSDANFSDYQQGIIDNLASQKDIKIVNGIDINNLLNTGKLEDDLYLLDYVNGADKQGIFQKSTNPNSPLFETRSQFIDKSKFIGSDYFYNKIGINLTQMQDQIIQNSQRMIGDQFFQTKIIENQLKSIRNDAFVLSDNQTNSKIEITSLLDNASDEYARLGLAVNQSLTQEQIDNLQKDIIWYEVEQINGESYITPKIYLSQATRQKLASNDQDSLAKKSSLMALGEIQLTANDDVSNSGDIISQDNITISSSNGNITNNNFSSIKAQNGLNISTNNSSDANNGNIINKSRLSSSQGNITLITAQNGNIINTATVATNDQTLLANSLNSQNQTYINNNDYSPTSNGNIFSQIIETALIQSAGDFTVNTNNSFNNVGADITTTNDGDINITTTSSNGNINIGTAQVRNKYHHSWGDEDEGGTIKQETINHTQSNINTNNGNINLNSQNNITLTSANITADNNNSNITINANNNVNLLTAQNLDSYSSSIKEVKNWGMTFTQKDKGHFRTNALDSNISISNGSNSSNININANNQILAQYNQDNKNNSSLDYLNNLDQAKTTLQAINNYNESWDESVSGLTDVGMAVVAVAAVAATAVGGAALGSMLAQSMGLATTTVAAGATTATVTLTTAGTMVAAGTAAAVSTAAVTASTTAVNTALNSKEGNFLKALEDVSKQAIKTTTSKESLKQMATSFATAALTAGLVEGIDTIADLATNSTNTINTVNNTNTTIQNITNTIIDASKSTLASTTTQAIMEGDSFIDTLKDQAINIAISTASNMAAKQIGANYKTSTQTGTDKAIQLTSHALLGAATAKARGTDEISGAVSGVVGEVTGEILRDRNINKKIGSSMAGLIGGYSAIVSGKINDQSNKDIADNIYSGNLIAKDIAENNAYFAKRPLDMGNKGIKKKLATVLSNFDTDFMDETNTEIVHEQLFFEDNIGGNIGFFSDGKIKSDKKEFLSAYKKTQEGFDDDIMREAIKNVNPKPYSLLGDITTRGCQKYNCQDWAEDVRQEYYQIQIDNTVKKFKNISDSLINLNYNQNDFNNR